MASEGVRCVVTGHVAGRAAFVSDGAPASIVSLPGATVWRLLQLDGLPRSADDGEPRSGAPAPLPPGGISAQIMQLDLRRPDTWPEGGGWRQADTLDLTVVVDGTLALGLEDGETVLGPGDTLVQRGTRHHMRATGGPVRALVAHLAPGDGTPQPLALHPATDGASGVRRVRARPLPADDRHRAPAGARAGRRTASPLATTSAASPTPARP